MKKQYIIHHSKRCHQNFLIDYCPQLGQNICQIICKLNELWDLKVNSMATVKHGNSINPKLQFHIFDIQANERMKMNNATSKYTLYGVR